MAEPDQIEQAQPPAEEKVIVANSGGQEQPLAASDQHDPSKAGPASAPDPRALDGIALPEDRAAGVQRGEVAKPPPAPEVAATP